MIKNPLVRRAVFLILLLGGCARLDYVKVPTPTQYQTWSDEQQKSADRMKGVRYYLPRPFLHLKQSVPVAQRVTLISFEADPKGTGYLLKLPVDAPEWVRRLAPARLSEAQALGAMASVLKGTNAGARGGANQAAGGTGGATNAAAGGTGTGAATEPPAQTLSGSVGYINDTDPVTRLGQLMDIVYLPDFEEQYVIRPRTGFAGQADIETRLRNGWAAETFKQKTDNSQLIPYVIRNVESASDAAARITTTWLPTATLGLPPGTTLAVADWLKYLGKGVTSAGTTQGATGSDTPRTAKDVLGSVLLFKLAEVRVAQPGVYPILKPREIQQWLKNKSGVVGSDPDTTFESHLQSAGLSWIRPDMAFIPCPPFTMIGFNATIDVFLLPVTERVQLEAHDSAVTPPQKTNDIQSLKSALLQTAKASFSTNTELTGLSESLISIDPDGTGGTVLKVVGAGSNKFDPAKSAVYVRWVEEAWKLKDGRDFKATVVSPATNAQPGTELKMRVDKLITQITEPLSGS